MYKQGGGGISQNISKEKLKLSAQTSANVTMKKTSQVVCFKVKLSNKSTKIHFMLLMCVLRPLKSGFYKVTFAEMCLKCT